MIIFCHADAQNLLRVLSTNQVDYSGYTWGMLGEDYKAYEKCHLLFGEENRDREIGPLFHSISRSLRTPILEFMGELARDNHSVEWWSTGLASKSIFQQDLFLRACYLRLIKETARRGRKILLFVGDVDFFFFLRKLFSERFIFVTDTTESFQKAKRHLYGLARKCWGLSRLTLHKVLLTGRRRELLDMETLVFSWVVDKSFDKSGHYRDLWGGSFCEEFLKVSACRRLTFSYVKPRPLRKSFLCDAAFVYTSSYCRWADILKLVGKKVVLSRESEVFFDGVNLRPLIDMEIRRNNSGPILDYLLFYKGLREIVDNSPNLRIIFHPFEGQPWEKMIKLAIRDSGREITTFGFQHSGFSELHLSNFCSKVEYDLGTMPDYILANSDYNRRKLGRDGYPPDKILTIGDLRYGYLDGKEKAVRDSGSKKVENILVCLTIKLNESLMVLRDCCLAFKKLKEKGYHFRAYVKPHPLRQFNMANLPFVKGLNGFIEYYDGDLKPMLDKSDLLIYVNGAVGCEALQLGKTVIQKMTDLSLDKDPLNPAEKQSLIYPCFFDELEPTIEMLLKDNNGKRKGGDGKQELPVFFDPAQAHAFRVIAELGRT